MMHGLNHLGCWCSTCAGTFHCLEIKEATVDNGVTHPDQCGSNAACACLQHHFGAEVCGTATIRLPAWLATFSASPPSLHTQVCCCHHFATGLSVKSQNMKHAADNGRMAAQVGVSLSISQWRGRDQLATVPPDHTCCKRCNSSHPPAWKVVTSQQVVHVLEFENRAGSSSG